MNKRPPSQHEAHTEEERELARVVRALPGGEPPAALDAFILKAATDAVASSEAQKHSLWGKGLLGTSALWLGTAAASVLTIGIGWQVFQSMRAPIYELPADENVRSAQQIDNHDKNESLVVEITPASEPLPTTPPPAEESDPSDDFAASVANTAKPAPALPEIRQRESAERLEMAEAAAKASVDETAKRREQAAEMAVMAAPAPPPPPMAAAAPVASADSSELKEMDSVSVTGSRIKSVDSEAGQPARSLSRASGAGALSPGIDEDAKLAPDLWLDAINDRLKRNDIEGAKASLKRYRETHPKLRIPEELLPLLK